VELPRDKVGVFLADPQGVVTHSHSDGFSYSWFCKRYKELAGRLKPTLRQVPIWP
jgi:hypothetical protein